METVARAAGGKQPRMGGRGRSARRGAGSTTVRRLFWQSERTLTAGDGGSTEGEGERKGSRFGRSMRRRKEAHGEVDHGGAQPELLLDIPFTAHWVAASMHWAQGLHLSLPDGAADSCSGTVLVLVMAGQSDFLLCPNGDWPSAPALWRRRRCKRWLSIPVDPNAAGGRPIAPTLPPRRQMRAAKQWVRAKLWKTTASTSTRTLALLLATVPVQCAERVRGTPAALEIRTACFARPTFNLDDLVQPPNTRRPGLYGTSPTSEIHGKCVPTLRACTLHKPPYPPVWHDSSRKSPWLDSPDYPLLLDRVPSGISATPTAS